jgi:hypothetical protein
LKPGSDTHGTVVAAVKIAHQRPQFQQTTARLRCMAFNRLRCGGRQTGGRCTHTELENDREAERVRETDTVRNREGERDRQRGTEWGEQRDT